MKFKYILYPILFVLLFVIITVNDSVASKKKIQYDTINVYFDKVDNQFFINDYNRSKHGVRERIIIHDNIIVTDSTALDGVSFGFCIKNKLNCLEKSFKKKLSHKIELNDGNYTLKIKTTDRYPHIVNRFFITNVNPNY